MSNKPNVETRVEDVATSNDPFARELREREDANVAESGSSAAYDAFKARFGSSEAAREMQRRRQVHVETDYQHADKGDPRAIERTRIVEGPVPSDQKLAGDEE